MEDVVAGSPADRAGLAPGVRLIGVGGRHFTAERLHDALRRGAGHGEKLELLVDDGDFFRTVVVETTAGERYPVLTRRTGEPDLLEKIVAPRAALARP